MCGLCSFADHLEKPDLQLDGKACAAVGQSGLITLYDTLFSLVLFSLHHIHAYHTYTHNYGRYNTKSWYAHICIHNYERYNTKSWYADINVYMQYTQLWSWYADIYVYMQYTQLWKM